jgi:glycosyltransferase involved in cell wall biosynthesis
LASGVEDLLHFGGVMSTSALTKQISSCDLFVFDDGGGPSPRKTTLATVLAFGKPVIAVDGPNTWSSLKDEEAVRLVPDSATLGDAVIVLAGDPAAREKLGRQAFGFYHRHQSRAIVSAKIGEFVEACLSPTARF